MLPAERDDDRHQPARHAQLRRRRQRLPPRILELRLLRLDGQRPELVRRHHPVPSLPTGDEPRLRRRSGARPSTATGVVYFAEIDFNRDDDTNGIWVMRSTNGGFTWSRPASPIADDDRPDEDAAAAAGAGDPRQPGDGTVTFFKDDNRDLDGSVPFDDKEYIATGPRPAGVGPAVLRAGHERPESHATRASSASTASTSRGRGSTIDAARRSCCRYSDDQARSWSPIRRTISGSAPFCAVRDAATSTSSRSRPCTRRTGLLGVAFENFNTSDENQYLFVRSRDGGATFQGPFFVTPVFDINYPLAGEPPAENRPDCAERGQAGQQV